MIGNVGDKWKRQSQRMPPPASRPKQPDNSGGDSGSSDSGSDDSSADNSIIGIAAIQKLPARAVVVAITDDLKLTKMRSVGFEC